MEISPDGRDGKGSPAKFIRDGAVSSFESPIDFDRVPFFHVTNILDGYAELAGPKKRHSVESLTTSEDVSRRYLTLTLGHDPVFDADELAGTGVGPTRDIAGRKDPRRTRFKEFVNDNPPINFQSSLLGELSSKEGS